MSPRYIEFCKWTIPSDALPKKDYEKVTLEENRISSWFHLPQLLACLPGSRDGNRSEESAQGPPDNSEVCIEIISGNFLGKVCEASPPKSIGHFFIPF